MAATREKTVKLKALEPILHDGNLILPGEVFEVSSGQAVPHLKNRTAEKE